MKEESSSPDDVPRTIMHLLNLRKQGGAISVLSVFIATVLLLLRLPDDQIVRLKELWWIISIPSILVLTSWMFREYISEMKSRTKVEEGIQKSLAILATNFEHLFAHEIDERLYFDTKFNKIDERLLSIYHAMEKRSEYTPGKDTEQFINGKE